MIVNLKEFIPNKLDYRDIFIKEEGKYLIISCNKIKPPRRVRLKNKINIDKSFLEIIGLYFGDGGNSLSGSGNRKVTLINTNFILHKYWIQFLNNFGINKNQLYIQIQKGFNSHLSDTNFIDYWSNKLNLPKDRFCKTLSVKPFNCVKYGNLVISYHSKLFRKIFNNIFEFSLNLCKKDKGLAVAFIRGLFAAEGYVGLNRYNSLNVLDISIKDKKRRLFVKNLFKKIGGKIADNHNRLKITGYLNFRLWKKFNLVGFHPNKKLKFNQGYEHLIKYGQVPVLTKLKIINSLKNGPRTRFQIACLLNNNLSTVYKSLKDLEIKGVVTKINKSVAKDGKKLRDVWILKQKPSNLFNLMQRDY